MLELTQIQPATEIEGIFRLNGSEKRIKELKTAFDSPDRYGKGLVWDGYTVHDASNVFRRYLNDLPEPVVPLDLYTKFRDPLRGATKAAGAGDAEGPQFVEGFDEAAAITKYQQLITELPPLNRQLLLYILDLLAVFAAKSEQNRMNSQNLAAIFQPGMLSHPDHAMAPEEYRLNQCVLIFLIENQDHFLIGMDGTAADEKTKQEVEQGTPTIEAPGSPSTPTSARPDGLGRTASNASAAAVSVRRDGMIRRNRSTASRHSRHDSTGGTAPSSPAVTTPTNSLTRSNTLPSKKSPALPSGRFQKDSSPMSVKYSNLSPNTEQPATRSRGGSPSPSALTPSAAGPSRLDPSSAAARSQEKLVGSGGEPVSTPVKERNLQSIFQKSPSSESDRRPRNKLKKRAPSGGVNRSAQSSTASLPHSGAVSPKLEPTRPVEPSEGRSTTPAIPEYEIQTSPGDESSEPTPRGSQAPPATLHAENSLKPRKSPPTSLHSSANEGSEMGQHEDPPLSASSTDLQEKERRKRWRISRGHKKEEGASPYLSLASPRQQPTSSSLQAESSTSIASKPGKSLTNDSSEPASSVMESQATQDSSFGQSEKHEGNGRDESKGPIGWIKNKYREAKETHEQRRAKSPTGDSHMNQPLPGTSSMVSFRGKSLDMQREGSGQGQARVSRSQTPQPQQSPPQTVPQVAPTPKATETAHEPQQVAPKVTPVPQEPQQIHQLPVRDVSPQHRKISLVAEDPIAEAQQAEIIQVVEEPPTPAAQTQPAPEPAQAPRPPADPAAGKAV